MAFPKPLFLLIIALGFIVPAMHLLSAEEIHHEKVTKEQDRIVKIHGYVFDTISDKEVALSVKARLVFESLPHGSEVGIITSNDTSGYYEYYVDLQNNYKIDVHSENHVWISEKFVPPTSVGDEGIRHDFYLEPQVKENQVIRLQKLIFEQGKSNITFESFGELNRLVNLMNQNSSMVIQLEGHTDYRGSKKLNMKLSQDRVAAVKEYIVGKGVNSRRIKAKAFGGTRPLIRESSLEASEINRRVEVRILKL
jgi:outer membrane protein OmpA-like peptidoglycan-associated protein